MCLFQTCFISVENTCLFYPQILKDIFRNEDFQFQYLIFLQTILTSFKMCNQIIILYIDRSQYTYFAKQLMFSLFLNSYKKNLDLIIISRLIAKISFTKEIPQIHQRVFVSSHFNLISTFVDFKHCKHIFQKKQSSFFQIMDTKFTALPT